MGLLSALVVSLVVACAVLAPWIAPHDPDAQLLVARLHGPGLNSHVLGTDQFGRDVLSRLIWGARNSLALALVPVAITFVVGTTIGLLSGMLGGWVDAVLMRILDVILAFPALLLAVALSAALGNGMRSAILALTVVSIPGLSRLVRASTLVLKEEPFVLAARSAGASEIRVAIHHVMPNLLAIATVFTTLMVGNLIVAGAALSYLGLGVQAPDADWGTMILDGSQLLSRAPHLSLIAGTVIFMTAMAFNLLGDSLRDALDPSLRSRGP